MESMPSQEAHLAIPVWVALLVGCVVGIPVYCGMVYGITKLTYWINVYVGLFFSLDFTFAGVLVTLSLWQYLRETEMPPVPGLKRWLIPFLEKATGRPFADQPTQAKSYEITAIAPIAALLAFSWASTAYGFARLRPAAYAHPEQITFWLMCKHYLWHTVDIMPLVDAWKNVHVEDPVKENHLWPGILVISFRLFMTLVVLRVAARILKPEKQDSKS